MCSAPKLTFLTETCSIDGRAGYRVFTDTRRQAALPIETILTELLAVQSLPTHTHRNIKHLRWHYLPVLWVIAEVFVCDHVCPTHRISWRTVALAGHRVTHPSIHTEAGLQATITIVTICTGFITVQPRPPRLTGTLPLQRVTAVTSTTQSKHMMTYGKIAEASHFLLSKQDLVNRMISWLIELIGQIVSLCSQQFCYC